MECAKFGFRALAVSANVRARAREASVRAHRTRIERKRRPRCTFGPLLRAGLSNGRWGARYCSKHKSGAGRMTRRRTEEAGKFGTGSALARARTSIALGDENV